MPDNDSLTDEGLPPLACERACVVFGGKTALNDVSLSVAAGEVYALIGPNGAGKSTLVKAICGRVPLSDGEVNVSGAPAGSRRARLRIGVAPQRPALYDRLTARENIACFARLAGAVGGEELAERALSLAGLPDVDRALAGRMSGGQRQRLNIAAAVAHGPALVILDEPSAALDREGVDGVNALIARLADSGVAVLLVTHDMTQAELLAGRVGVLSSGRLVAEDSPTGLRESYGGAGLVVTIVADASAAPVLSAEAFDEIAPRRWSGRLANQGEVAALAEKVGRIGGSIRSIETAAPTLSAAVAALLSDAKFEGRRA